MKPTANKKHPYLYDSLVSAFRSGRLDIHSRQELNNCFMEEFKENANREVQDIWFSAVVRAISYSGLKLVDSNLEELKKYPNKSGDS